MSEKTDKEKAEEYAEQVREMNERAAKAPPTK